LWIKEIPGGGNVHESQINDHALAFQELVGQMRAVTISREYGSGGGEIAQRLATRLGWQLIDYEIVTLLAYRLGISVQEAEEHDEHAAGLVQRLLTNMRSIEPAMLINLPPGMAKPEEVYHRALHQVVRAAARERHAIIVGRGGQVVLGQRRDVLHIRVIAPLELRIRYVMLREQLDYGAARTRIQMKDRDRRRYLQTQYQCDNADPHLYDLVCNTSVLNLDQVVDIICSALAHKATRAQVTEDDLGPASSVTTPYPTHPGDFRPLR
jgi:cytidylate kinase